MLTPRVTETKLETDMKTIVLVLSLIALAAPAQAALKTQSRHDSQSLEQKCREMVGKEQYEGEGRSHIGQMQAQRFSDCMIGMPNRSRAVGAPPRASFGILGQVRRDDHTVFRSAYSHVGGAIRNHGGAPLMRLCRSVLGCLAALVG